MASPEAPIRLNPQILSQQEPLRMRRGRERGSRVSALEQRATALWENSLVHALGRVIQGPNGGEGRRRRSPITMLEDREGFATTASPIAGVFIDNPPAGDAASEF